MSKALSGLSVMVGLSGGVDSAVSAALLKRAGANVVGAFIKTWSPEWLACTWKDERRDAMRVAAHLDIPFVTIDLEKEYKKGVADYMIAEYRLGRTPNPDVMCNKEIKFGAFLRAALSMGADAIATGHYAQIGQKLKVESKKWELKRGKDMSKDQSYFLWTLSQEQLSKTIFPVGHLDKSEVRELAKEFKLPVAEKKDSQGICFLGHIDMREFLSHYIKTKIGAVLDQEGNKLGEHDGSIFYTIGQAWQRPYYVIAKNLKKNTITVSALGSDPSVKSERIMLKDVNWISGGINLNELNSKKFELTAEVRYHGEQLACRLIKHEYSSGGRASLMSDQLEVGFEKPVLVAPGQSVVIYKGMVCLGGGIVA